MRRIANDRSQNKTPFKQIDQQKKPAFVRLGGNNENRIVW